MSESKFQYLHFYNVGLTNSKLVVLVSRHAQSGSGKRQDFTCSKWEWKGTRFYKGSWHNSKCRPHQSLSPPTIPPSIPNFTYPTQIVWFWVPSSITIYYVYVLRLTLWVGYGRFLWESGPSSLMMMLNRFKTWSTKKTCCILV